MTESDAKQEREHTVLSRILSWSESRPLWQQDALRRIVQDGFPDEQALDEILALCKKEHGDETIQITVDPLSGNHLPVAPHSGESVSLESISNVAGVNQLASGQTLAFELDGLNIVYGRNGVGKSGYTRILKKACRSRHAGEIMPDVYRPPPSGFAMADLSVKRANKAVETVRWENQDGTPEVLSAITVFDRESASVHVRKKNEVWFRPFGLDIPDDLVGVCQEVKKRLMSEKENLEAQRNAAFTNPPWSDRSAFGKALSMLCHDTNLESIAPDKPFSREDEARLAKLRADLAQDPATAAKAQRDYANQLDVLAGHLDRIEQALNAEAVSSLLETKRRADDARATANAAAYEAFSELKLEGVGEVVWRKLWESAREYSKTARKGGLAFPPSVDDICVLCHQKIDESASSRMLRFEEFIKEDTEIKAATAEQALNEAQRKFAELEVHIRQTSPAYRSLKANNLPAAKRVLRYIAVARLKQRQTLSSLEGEEAQCHASLLDPVSGAVKTEAVKARNYADSLEDAEGGSAREAVLNELADLEDRKRRDEFLEIARSEIVRLKTLQRVEDCLSETATNAITMLGNEIADKLITPRMHEQFEQEINKLTRNHVRVEVARSGGQPGSPQYQVRLYGNPKAKVHDVLSEGEQTCVALASYLTELVNADHASALIFDDPVSSLDHRWRSKVAKRLVDEARTRQVIVFTHDMIFVNDLHQQATDKNVSVTHAHLTRGQDVVGIVNKGLPWEASKIPDRIDKLEKSVRKAIALFEERDDEAYKHEAASLYGKLRATWERALEDIMFANVIVRHRDYIRTEGLKRVPAIERKDIETFLHGFRKCSNFVEAHDSSRGHDLEPPDPDEILQDIQTLKNWSEDLRLRMKAEESDSKP